MTVKKIAYKPELTTEQAEQAFRRHFEPKYKVEPCTSPLSLKTKYRDFQVVQNAFVGVALKLDQRGTETRFVYAAVPPTRWIRTVSLGVAGLFCWLRGGPLTNEVEAFIESSPEFR